MTYVPNILEQALLLAEKLPDGIVIVDTNGSVRYTNTASKLFFQDNNDNFVGNLFEYPLIPDKLIEIKIARNSGEYGTGEMRVFEIKLEDNIYYLVTVRDITEHKLFSELLSKSSRFNSIGVIAGGIAHDFNNLVTVILGYVSMVKFDIKGNPNISNKLTMVEKASLEAKNLAQQLLTFSKGGTPVKINISIVDTIKDSSDFALRGSNVKCQYYISDDLWSVEIDEGQMNQVFNNLIINSRQAMPEGGFVSIKAENKIIENDFNENGLQLQRGKHIKISIRDRGIGISEKHLGKIFAPYFTSKQNGNGLGLATIYSIIKKHEGLISVKSKLGVGTTFYIYLPASEKAVPKKIFETSRIVKGKGKILVMDDDKSIRDITEQSLRSVGYNISLAENGLQAIKVYKKAKEIKEPFDAVIIDLTIQGGMGGKETISELVKIDPDVKAIVSSGYVNNPVMVDYKKYGFKDYVAKPFKIEELSNVVHNVININSKI